MKAKAFLRGQPKRGVSFPLSNQGFQQKYGQFLLILTGLVLAIFAQEFGFQGYMLYVQVGQVFF